MYAPRQRRFRSLARSMAAATLILGCALTLALSAAAVVVLDGHGTRAQAQNPGIIPTPFTQFRRNLSPTQIAPLAQALQASSIAAAVRARHAKVGRTVDPQRCEVNWTMGFAGSPVPRCVLVNHAGWVWQTVTPEEACSIQTGSPRWQAQNPQILCLR